jgi:AraC family transcriptional regulator of adaptative response/methylated-DNA-[protein]-cysteine methyltransferase
MLTIDQDNVEMQSTSNNLESQQVDDERWAAILTRNSEFDGKFVFAVQSTGIYCKPSCPAKHPRRVNVVFFSGSEGAEQSGFRPCKRCRPHLDQRSNRIEAMDRVCKYIEVNLNRKLTLSELSAHARMSPYHFQRIFKRTVGISPRQYAETRRVAKMKRLLRSGQTVTKALYGAGFNSRSRIYEKMPNQLGMSPGVFRRGGVGLQIDYTIVNCPLGRLLVGATERGICAVHMGDSDSTVEVSLSEEYPAASLHRDDQRLREWVSVILNYFAGQDSTLKLPLDVQATAFQWKVWKAIQSIPYGGTTTYSKLAAEIGSPKAARAVARACATNPTSLLIPCHRVIGEDGTLHGYRWGKKRKQDLLKLEQAHRR